MKRVRISKNAFGRRASLMLLALVLIGCGGTIAAPTVAPTSQPAPAAPIALVLWHATDGANAELLELLAIDYQRAHPNTEIRLQEHGPQLLREYQAAVRAGGPPDLVLLSANHWVGTLAEQQLILDLSSQISAEEQARFLPAALGGAQFNQRLYGLPLLLDVPVLFYNRSNFPGGAPPDTTDAWLANARGLRANEQYGLAYQLSWYFTQPYLPAFGGAVLDETGAVVLGSSSLEASEQWLSWVQALANDPELLARDDHRLLTTAVEQNAVVMAVDWAQQLPTYRNVWGDNVAIRPLPILSETNRAPEPYVRTSVLAINPRSPAAQQQAALELMRYLTADDAQERLRAAGLPSVRSDLAPDSDELQQEISRAAQAGQPWPTTLRVQAHWEALLGMVRNVLNGTAPRDAIQYTDGVLRQS